MKYKNMIFSGWLSVITIILIFSRHDTLAKELHPTTYSRQLDHRHHVMVLVLEIPLFSQPNINSPIIDYRRKGDILYVKENISEGAPWRPNYDLVQYFEETSYDEYVHSLQKTDLIPKKRGDLNAKNIVIQRDGFFTTLDQIGRVSYIPKVFVKPLYHDGRELIETVNRFEHDPMDYRPPEPLGPSYPFVEYRDLIFHAQLSNSPGDSHRVHYQIDPLTEDYGSQWSLRFGFGKKLAFDINRRWSFGMMVESSWQKSAFKLAQSHYASERIKKMSLGPFMGYEVFRGEFFSGEILGGIMVSPWYRVSSSESGESLEIINREFKAFQVSPHIGAQIFLPAFLESQKLGLGANFAYPIPFGIEQTFSSKKDEPNFDYQIRPTPDFSFFLAYRGQF